MPIKIPNDLPAVKTLNDENKEIKWFGTFMNLPKGYDKLKFKYFTIGVTVHEYVASTYFKFYL